MNDFERSIGNLFGAERFNRIQQTRVGIAGLGGLGSNCASFLVRSGFRLLTLCDFDIVEIANLNRQFYFSEQLGRPKTAALQENLLRINSNLDLTLIDRRLTKSNVAEMFSACDAVIEAFDTVAAKQLIAAAYSRSGKFFVCASGLAGWSSADEIVTTKIHDNCFLIGDKRSAVSTDLPPCAPRVCVAAAKQADLVLAWTLNRA